MNNKKSIRQNAIIKYMQDIIAKKGFAPTVREIRSALNIKSTSTVHSDINELVSKGILIKDPSKPRALVLTSEYRKADSSSSLSTNEDINMIELPVIGRVAAGKPILAEENIEEYIPLPSRFLNSGTNFLLTVHGDSMVNIGINNGDYIIVNETQFANNGDIVVAIVDGAFEPEATVKRYFKENGHIRLQPENDYMNPIIVDDARIVGKVKGVFRYFN